MKRSIFVAFLAMAACPGGANHAPVEAHPVVEAHPIGAAPLLRGSVRMAPAPYCGGARLSEEEMARRPSAPTPAGGVAVIVRAGKTNSDAAPVAELTTAADGTFAKPMPPGTYCLVLDDKRSQAAPGQYTDAACLAQYFQQCDAIAEVPSATPADFVHGSSCFGPCYHGPMPP